MICRAFVITVVDTFHRLAVNADDLTGMLNCAGKSVILSVRKAFTAGSLFGAGMLPAHHDITLTAILAFVIYAVFNRTI